MTYDFLSQGSEGRLWLDGQVVVKEISDPQLLAYFTEQEIARRSALWFRLNQNGFCAPFAIQKTERRLVFRSRFVPGACLSNFAPDSVAYLEGVYRGARQLVKLHEQGVLHGDLSPGNLLSCGTWIDWTSADYMGRDFFRGTFTFSAPEYSHLGNYTRASEIFVLGSLLSHAAVSDSFKLKAMHPLPHLRFSSAQEFADELARLADFRSID